MLRWLAVLQELNLLTLAMEVIVGLTSDLRAFMFRM